MKSVKYTFLQPIMLCRKGHLQLFVLHLSSPPVPCFLHPTSTVNAAQQQRQPVMLVD
jgi:hypothetical protein